MERNILNEELRLKLIDKIQAMTGLILPPNDFYLGRIEFLLYIKEEGNPGNDSFPKSSGCVFQIRWGSKSLFLDKNIKLDKGHDVLNCLNGIIETNVKDIRRQLIRYCVEQLHNIVLAEFPIALRTEMPEFSEYKVFIALTRTKQKNSGQPMNGWPAISIFISFDDETGEFQEFVYPISFDTSSCKFHLDYNEIIGALRRFQDSI